MGGVTPPQEPYFAFDDINVSVDTVARVNLGNGNLLLTANDGVLNGPALSVRNDRFYNGLSSAAGSLGGGWSSPLSAQDVGLQVTGTQAVFSGPNGFQATFTKSGATWVAPAGFKASLVDTTPTRTLTYNQTGEKFIFNTAGWITQNLNRDGEGTTYQYDPSLGLVSNVYEASGRSYAITWTTVGANTLISSIVDSAGRTFTYTSNAGGQLTRVDSPGGFWEEFTYDATGRVSEIHFVGTGPASTHTKVVFDYDAQHRVIAVKRGTVTSGTFLTTSTYAYTSGQTVVTDGRGKNATYAIDASGRVTSATDALGRVRATTWTADSDVSTLTDALAGPNTTTYSYDALNNATGATLPTGAAASAAYATGVGCTGTGGTAFQPKCTTDAAGSTKSFDYDANGNPTTVTDTTASGTGAVPQQFTYESGGTVCGGFDGQVCTSMDGNGNVTTNAYDTDGNLVTVTPPSPQGATTYTYDSLGRVLTVTDGNSDTTTYAYNLRDAIVLTTFQGGQTLTQQYFANGLKQRDTDSVGPLKNYYWDALGRQTRETTVTTSTVEVTFTYDAAGNTTSYDDNAYGTVNYVYDDANQLVQLIEPSGSCPAGTGSPANSGCVKFVYDANGAETTRTFPGNATITTVNDASSRPTRITATDSAAAVKVDIGYSYTAPGGSGPSADRTAIQSRTSFAETSIPAGAVTGYVYDSLSRLTSATEMNGAATNASWAYTYDAAGNRTQQVRAGSTGATAGTIGYTYNAANRLASTTADTTTWTYDGAGNQTRNGATAQTAAFNSRGTVTGIGSATYTAFGQGNTEQLTRSTSSTKYLSSPLGLMGENLGGPSRTFDRTPDGEAVGVRLSAGSRYYYAKDKLGSVVGQFDKTGAYLGGYAYSPYGEQRAISAGSPMTNNNLRYIGGYLDSASGLYKLGARYYDPSMGRFTQYDPSGQETHPYGYAGCNPVNTTDPTGLSLSGSTICGITFLLEGLLISAAIAAAGLSAGASLAVGAAASVALFAGSEATC